MLIHFILSTQSICEARYYVFLLFKSWANEQITLITLIISNVNPVIMSFCFSMTPAVEHQCACVRYELERSGATEHAGVCACVWVCVFVCVRVCACACVCVGLSVAPPRWRPGGVHRPRASACPTRLPFRVWWPGARCFFMRSDNLLHPGFAWQVLSRARDALLTLLGPS